MRTTCGSAADIGAEVLLPPQVLADACLDLYGLGQELRVEVKRGSGVSFSGTERPTVPSTQLLFNSRCSPWELSSRERPHDRQGEPERDGTLRQPNHVVLELGHLRHTQKGSETGILAIHTQQDHSELFAFKFFAAIAKGCASLPDCEALLLQLYARQVL